MSDTLTMEDLPNSSNWEEKLKMVFENNYPTFLAVAIRITHNEPDATNVVAQVYVKLHSDEKEDINDLISYIKKCIRNQIKDLAKKKKPMLGIDYEKLCPPFYESTQFEDNQHLDYLKTLVNFNPEQEAIWQYKRDGMETERIASIMGISTRFVTVQFQIMLKKLRKAQHTLDRFETIIIRFR